MKKASHTAVLAFLTGTLAAGCAGLLGLDDKTFEGEGGTGGAPTGGTESTAGTGGISGGPAGGMGGTGGAGGGLGGTGGGCTLSEAEKARVTDDFDLDTCGEDAVPILESRGWSFSRYVEDYPTGAADAITGIESGSLEVRLDQTMYWFNGTKGYLMYKKIKGDFLVVTDVSTTNGDKSGIPTNEQSGAGILVRDPAGASTDMNGQRWLAVDLGANKQADLTLLQALHISWCKPGMPDICLSNPVVTGVPLSGLIGVCRIGGTYAIWYKQGGTWKEQTSPAGWGQVAMPDEVQVGLFAYASNPPGDSPDGVIGTFPSVHQIDPEKGCEPSKYE